MKNQLSILGIAGGDAEVKTLGGGESVISFSVAVTEKFKNAAGEAKEKTTWFNCSKWFNPGVSTKVSEFIRKGDKIGVDGSVSTRAYLGPNNDARSSLDVRVDSIYLLGNKKDGAASETPEPKEPVNEPNSETPANEGQSDDLPF